MDNNKEKDIITSSDGGNTDVAVAEREKPAAPVKEGKKRRHKLEDMGPIELDIPDSEVWTYRVEGLAAPAIHKQESHKTVKQVLVVVAIVVAVSLSIYFSVRAVHRDTFEYSALGDGNYELTGFSNIGYIKEININYALDISYDKNISDPEKNFIITEDKTKPVTELNSFAFNCDNVLSVVNIGANVQKIEGDTFYSCYGLTAINVDEANQYYSSVDGVLFNKDKTELICCPINHSEYLRQKYGYEKPIEPEEEGYDEYREKVLTYVVPSTVEKIGELSFNYTDITDLYLPEGLKTIDTMSFFKSKMLANIYSYKGDTNNLSLSLPSSLEYIGSDAFSYVQTLTYMYIPKNVNYIGHHAFWECVYKKDGEIMGLSEMNVEADEDVLSEVHLGDQWLPEYDYKLFKKKVEVKNSSARAEA